MTQQMTVRFIWHEADVGDHSHMTRPSDSEEMSYNGDYGGWGNANEDLVTGSVINEQADVSNTRRIFG